MSAPGPPPLPVKFRAASPEKALDRLFLTIFLRGHSSRGLNRSNFSTSIAHKLGLSLALYGLLGLSALLFLHQTVFALSVYLHATTFVTLGMFVVASAGETLFNKEESDILMHRPVTPKMLIRAKVGVLIRVSLWLAFAMNCVGFFVGVAVPGGGWLYPVAHAFSTFEEALFCTACVVLVYELCLKWIGRERMEGVLTTMQVLLMISVTVGSQVMARTATSFGSAGAALLKAWWINFLPPAWFAGFDDAIAGSRSTSSLAMGGIGLGVTAVSVLLALGKLATSYESGVKALSEPTAPKAKSLARVRWLQRAAGFVPMRWFLKGSVEKASFVLAVAYMLRDREVKLRLYPAIAPLIVIPAMMLFGGGTARTYGSFWVYPLCIGATDLGVLPMLALSLLRYSQQWKSAEAFQVAPTAGPWAVHRGAQVAVLTLLCLPAIVGLGLYIGWSRGPTDLPVLLPGIISMPVYALLPAFITGAVPLARPSEEAQSANRGLYMTLAMFFAIGLGGVAAYAWLSGWFAYLVVIEAVVAAILCLVMNSALRRVEWAPTD